MKRLLSNITDSLADAVLHEMGIDINRTAEHRPAKAQVPFLSKLKRVFRSHSMAMADAALLELGVLPGRTAGKPGSAHETLEENLIEVAFAEAADYDDIHKAILRELRSEQDIIRPDECQHSDNDIFIKYAA